MANAYSSSVYFRSSASLTHVSRPKPSTNVHGGRSLWILASAWFDPDEKKISEKRALYAAFQGADRDTEHSLVCYKFILEPKGVHYDKPPGKQPPQSKTQPNLRYSSNLWSTLSSKTQVEELSSIDGILSEILFTALHWTLSGGNGESSLVRSKCECNQRPDEARCKIWREPKTMCRRQPNAVGMKIASSCTIV